MGQDRDEDLNPPLLKAGDYMLVFYWNYTTKREEKCWVKLNEVGSIVSIEPTENAVLTLLEDEDGDSDEGRRRRS
jgi:hypothetical protein